MKERILIIGGTGFIGKYLTKKCHGKGFLCSVISLNVPKKENKIEGVDYYQCDLSIYDQLYAILHDKKFEYVVNLSGYINHSSFYSNEGLSIINSHFSGVINILRIIDPSPLRHFIQIGSSDEYGSLPAPQSEEMREQPISPYSFSKTATTHLMQMLFRSEKFPVTIIRLFLVYGEGQDLERFLPQVILGSLKNRDFPVSLGEQYRDFTYVGDIVDGIIECLDIKDTYGEIINLASGKKIMIRDVVRKVIEYTGKGSAKFGEIEYRSCENMELYASILKAQRLINWQPLTSFETGLKRTIEYIKSEVSNQYNAK